MGTFKFDEIAFNSTEKKKPVDEDKYTYLGLEHLDSDSIYVTRYGADVAPKGDKLIMKKGDVLFGKRRAYQKKVAIAPFDGIFSAHGMVLRPKEDVIDKDFFPMFIKSDYFLDAAIKISVGSLSPTINWRDLKELKFELPSLEEQRKLAEILWAIYDMKDKYKKLILATDELVKSQFIEMFGDPIENEKGWRTIPLLQTGKCKNGMNYSSKDCGVEMHCLGVADFQDNAVIDDMSVLPMVSLKESTNTDYLLQNGDIVFVRSNGNRALVGRSVVVYPGDEPVVYSGFCIRYRKEREELLTDYLLRFFKTDSVRAKMAGRGANIQNLNQQILAALNIPIPPIEMQKEFSVFVKQSDKSKFYG